MGDPLTETPSLLAWPSPPLAWHPFLLAWQADLVSWLQSPVSWGLLCGIVAMWLIMPSGSHVVRVLGGLVGLVALGLIAAGLPWVQGILAQGLFLILAGVTVVSAAAAVAMRSAVYCALWFALSLMGTAGLFLYDGAAFLGVATVVVYAGAIVVTFLFVVMLAQPEGHAMYDRLTWGWYVKPFSVLAAGFLVAVLTAALGGLERIEPAGVDPLVADAAAARASAVLHENHVARFGAELFSRYLVSIEVAGTLLLVSLVGAVAIMVQGRRQEGGRNAVPADSADARHVAGSQHVALGGSGRPGRTEHE